MTGGNKGHLGGIWILVYRSVTLICCSFIPIVVVRRSKSASLAGKIRPGRRGCAESPGALARTQQRRHHAKAPLGEASCSALRNMKY
ncbi:Hypothetical predicted protein [Podarcis lilfordi]|uniref:Uncharacterized protein n=1 Tax=Podarcis lilfordi TaxID=74358 RepID=A0AA35KZX3_9SAUR|nr:Hypothetical predicted protein [Podarcis lilfordi]